MRCLIGCESSGVVREAFRALGHDAWSCDILAAQDNSPYHIQDDVLNHLNDGWDLMIAHPSCQYLSVSGMHWTTRGLRDPQLTEDALDFVRKLMAAPINKIAIENPVSVISTRIRKPDQILQPYEYGENASKKTCLWLKNLPLLIPNSYFPPKYFCCGMEIDVDAVGLRGCANCCGAKSALPRWGNQTASGQNKLPPSANRWQQRSKTYFGIAKAMSEQWSK